MREDALTTRSESLITGEELVTKEGVGPCELVEGRIVPMVPTGDEHGGCEAHFASVLLSFVKPRKLGKVRAGEVGIYTRRNPDTVRAADVLFITKERYAQRQRKSGYLDVAPDLIVEILSPDDSWSRVMHKLGEYFACGVRLVWVADPETRTIHSYRSLTDVRVLTEKDHLPGDEVLPGFSVPVASLFDVEA